MTEFKPRPYQIETVERVFEGWANHRRQLIVLPTGAGKTCVFAMCAARTPGRTLVLTHREELIDQAIAKIHAVTGIYAGKEKAEFRASKQDRIVVASVQSMIKRLNNWRPNHFDLIVADEAHHSISRMWRRVIQHFSSYANLIGVTATADRADKRNLGEMYQAVAHEVFLDDLIRDGYLSPIRIQTAPIKIDLNGVKTRAGDFASEDVGHALEPYLPGIAREIRQRAHGRRTLAFLPLVATSHKFVAACESEGLRVQHIDGNSPDRREILQAFADGAYDVLSNAMLLTEGFDDPGISCVCNLRPTQSRALFTQIVGRGTRLAPGKENLLLLDFLWQHERHKLIRPAHLSRLPDEVVEEMVAMTSGDQARDKSSSGSDCLEYDLLETESEAQKIRERKLASILEASKNKAASEADLLEVCKRIGAEDALDYQPRFTWQRDPVTPKQQALLEKAGVDPDCLNGRGQASRIIDAYLAHENNKPASDKQRAAMRRAGVVGWETATRAEAKQFFASGANRFSRSASV